MARGRAWNVREPMNQTFFGFWGTCPLNGMKEIKHLNLLLMFAILCIFHDMIEIPSTWAYDGNVIMTFGDSITVGYPYLPGSGWAANGCHCGPMQKELEALLVDSDRTSLVLNWGKGGESTELGVDRISSDMGDAIDSWGKLDFVLIMEGTNDYAYGISSNTTAFNVGVMINKVRRYDAVPIVGTLTPDTGNPGKNIPKYNSAIESEVEDQGAVLVDHYSRIVDDWDSLTSDGLHPNEEGYDFIAAVWFDSLTSLIEKDHKPVPLFIPIILLLNDDK